MCIRDRLRTAALDIITELGIEGGCNCQFALKPVSYTHLDVYKRQTGNFAVLPKPLPLRKDFPRPGEDVAQRQKGECGICLLYTSRCV